MKIWRSYGSEHSMNLVMIGHFKSVEDAEKTQRLINQLREALQDKVDVGEEPVRRFSDEVMAVLEEAKCYILGTSELEQLLYDTNTKVEGDKVILTTDESDVSAFFKLMLHNNAKIEMYSAHEYSNTEYGRGK